MIADLRFRTLSRTRMHRKHVTRRLYYARAIAVKYVVAECVEPSCGFDNLGCRHLKILEREQHRLLCMRKSQVQVCLRD